jgi:hypothetical protein
MLIKKSKITDILGYSPSSPDNIMTRNEFFTSIQPMLKDVILVDSTGNENFNIHCNHSGDFIAEDTIYLDTKGFGIYEFFEKYIQEHTEMTFQDFLLYVQL